MFTMSSTTSASRGRGIAVGSRREAVEARTKICVVGSGSWFLSGISYYTHEVAAALSEQFAVSGNFDAPSYSEAPLSGQGASWT